MRSLSLFLPLALLAAPGVDVAVGEESADGTPAVLIELFTSQGCSSCPPADRLLAELARRGRVEGVDVIPLAFHVDYWNYIGWRDPFSSESWSRRQRAYATAFGLETIYTPQIFLNGRRQIVGADERELRREIRRTAGKASALELVLVPGEVSSDGLLAVEVGASWLAQSPDRHLVALLALFQDGLVTPVSRGENARRTLQNERVVRALRSVFELGPDEPASLSRSVELELAPDWPLEDLGLVLLVQDTLSMEVVAATSARLAGGDLETDSPTEP